MNPGLANFAVMHVIRHVLRNDYVVTIIQMTLSLPQGVPVQSRREMWKIRQHDGLLCWKKGNTLLWEPSPSLGQRGGVAGGWYLLSWNSGEEQELDRGRACSMLLLRKGAIYGKCICFSPHVLSPYRFLSFLSGIFFLNTNSFKCFLYL